ncbi:MAG: ABC transporter ATP-binding protein [Chitinophagales bacterium]|nr:ABC transporter ATP-binding protein [Chitinophagales bacterium]
MQELEFNQDKTIFPFLKRMFVYVWTYERNKFILMLIAAGIVGFIDSLYPYLFSQFINDCLVNNNKSNASLANPCLQKYLWYLAAMIVATCSFVFLFIYAAGTISERTIFNMRKQLFEKLQFMTFSYFDKNSAGWLLSRISSDTDRVSEVISWGLIGMAWAIVSIVFSIGIMLSTHFLMGLMILLSIPVMIYLSSQIRKLILKYSRLSRKINSEMVGLINEHIHGVELNKILSNEDKAVQIFQSKAIEHRKASYKSAFYSAAFFPIIIIVGNIAAASVLGYGVVDIIKLQSGLTIGALSAFFIYSIQIFEPISDISNYYSIAQNSLSAGERIFNLLDDSIEKGHENFLNDFTTIRGEIRLDHIHFAYNDEKKVLSDFNLHIAPGEQIALVGPTGEGKSTIASILAQLYKPQEGKLYVDEQDVSKMSLSSFRHHVGIVLQQPHVFSGTIADNVRYGNKKISNEKVKEIFEWMGCDDLANRIEEILQPDGINLSIGEKQLIAIARVFAYDPKILILDEATSSIDSITEQKLQKAVKQVLKGRTSIVIAHRLSTIIESDRILYIQNGQIIEQGSHQELMTKKGVYWKLHQVA